MTTKQAKRVSGQDTHLTDPVHARLKSSPTYIYKKVRFEQLHPDISRNIRLNLISECRALQKILLTTQNTNSTPRGSQYKNAKHNVSKLRRRLLEPDCHQQRMKEKTQVALLNAIHQLEFDALLRNQGHEREKLYENFSRWESSEGVSGDSSS